MYCNQCEQARGGIGCLDTPGVCGKDADVQSLQEILLYGVKGMAAYASHARRLGRHDEEVSTFIEQALFATLTNVNFDIPTLLELVLVCGRMNLKVMQMLNDAHVARFGTPQPTEVYEGTKAGPGILVTGHDLLDLEDLLKQTEGKGINIYTHGEMLPAHSYPQLKKYKHLVGHYGGAWQKQVKEFSAFSGPVLATTNCILVPQNGYAERVFTTRCTAVPGGTRIAGNDFTPLIQKALSCPPLPEQRERTSTIGFHYSTVLSLGDKVVAGVKSGAIKHFYVIGGCDGAEPGRNYFSDFAEKTPENTVILTLGCGKYRIRNHDYGTLGGIPRLLDMGQCNDSYGAIQVALALSKAFGCGVNDLPLTLVISWFEQKAVAVLLTLLHLGVKGIRIGPNPPAFVTPNVLKVLQNSFDLRLTGGDAAADLAATLASQGEASADNMVTGRPAGRPNLCVATFSDHMNKISLQNVTKLFDSKAAVKDVSFEISAGQVFGLLGPNGAGKTTLIRMLVDIIKPDSGTILYDGFELTPESRNRITYLPEERGLYKKEKVLDMLVYLARLKGMSKGSAQERSLLFLKKLEMQGTGDMKIEQLSKGNQQKIQIAATLVSDPELIILDEPFSGLDPLNVRLTKELLAEERGAGKTIVLSTHQMNQVEELCNHLLMINQGRTVLYGPLDQIVREHSEPALLLECSPIDGDIPEIARVENQGKFLKAYPSAGVQAPELLHSLLERGVRIERFQPATTSLEEIFVNVARQCSRETA